VERLAKVFARAVLIAILLGTFALGGIVLVFSTGGLDFFDPMPTVQLRKVSGKEARSRLPAFWPEVVSIDTVDDIFYLYSPTIDSGTTLFRARMPKESADKWASFVHEELQEFSTRLRKRETPATLIAQRDVLLPTDVLEGEDPSWWTPTQAFRGSESIVVVPTEHGHKSLETVVTMYDDTTQVFWLTAESLR
jgi:hypothetical protein